ncbi:MAG: bifunctional 4-hydroxy-2-oxoglutarate aldolase/2-dehydro-3-deoxy-phosphogluconate aldolase [Planctomycetota bacterium]
MEFIEQLKNLGVVAVIRASGVDHATEICRALAAGGVRGLELTYSTPDCCEAIKRMVDEMGESSVIGVGTVRTVEQLEAAQAAGASFAVSPHFDPDIATAALELKIPMLPGAITPTEVVQVWQSGAAGVKIFPGSLVGPSYLKALRGPLPDIPLMPTGGVSVENMAEWFAAGAVAVGMGGNLAKGSAADIEATARAVTEELARIRAG